MLPLYNKIPINAKGNLSDVFVINWKNENGKLKLHLSLSPAVLMLSPQPPLTPMTTVSVIFFSTCLLHACADAVFNVCRSLKAE